MRRMGFEKVVLSQVKTVNNKDGWKGYTIFLPLKLMDKHAIATEKNNISKSFRKKIEIFLQIYYGIYIKQTGSYCEN